MDRESFLALESWKKKVGGWMDGIQSRWICGFVANGAYDLGENPELSIKAAIINDLQVEDEVDEIVMCIVQNKIDLIDEAIMTP